MPNKLTSLTGFGEGDPKPEKKGAKSKALSAKMGDEKARDTARFGKSFRNEKTYTKSIQKAAGREAMHNPSKRKAIEAGLRASKY